MVLTHLSGSDIYSAGTQENATAGLAMACYWKNDDPTVLTTGTTTIAVANSVLWQAIWRDMSMTSTIPVAHPFAKYWKNGTHLFQLSGVAMPILLLCGAMTYMWRKERRQDCKYWKMVFR